MNFEWGVNPTPKIPWGQASEAQYALKQFLILHKVAVAVGKLSCWFCLFPPACGTTKPWVFFLQRFGWAARWCGVGIFILSWVILELDELTFTMENPRWHPITQIANAQTVRWKTLPTWPFCRRGWKQASHPREEKKQRITRWAACCRSWFQLETKSKSDGIWLLPDLPLVMGSWF